MRKIKDVLRLRASGYSTRRISDSLGLGRTSTRNYLQRAAQTGLSWPDVQDLDEVALPLCQRSCPPLCFSSISQVGGIG